MESLDLDTLLKRVDTLLMQLLDWFSSPAFYAQCGLVLAAFILAWSAAGTVRHRVRMLREPPEPGPLYGLRRSIYDARDLIFPLLLTASLVISADLSEAVFNEEWLVRVGLGIAVVYMLYALFGHLVSNAFYRRLVSWILVPASILHVFGWLDDVTAYLDTIAIQIGNIKLSAYGVLRVLVFGMLLIWLGRMSRNTGQRIIRSQEDLDVGTREVFAKLFEVTLVFVLLLLLLQVMGINLTALAVFGGAVGVGLGFGLQAIASNFISGIILLLDRSLTVSDYIELEDGRTGTIREMNMRSATLETFDGKDIMVPNEKFMTSTFVNWTHKNNRQRYPLRFQVAYRTDLELLFQVVRSVVASHPQVISGADIPVKEQPDAEIESFGDSGINILVEFWMEGIDDGENRVGGDLLFMIWGALREHDIEIPFPQREIKVLGDDDTLPKARG